MAARQLIPQGDTVPLAVEDYAWSPDRKRLLIFTNTQPVWRLNTRGDYWVLDRASRHAAEARRTRRQAVHADVRQVLARRRAGRLRAREQPLRRGSGDAARSPPLTTDGSRTLINGTFDWVYEEELMNYYADGWRWSPDGRSIAYWQLNADQVEELQPDQQHRFALLAGDPGPVSQGRRGELGRARRSRVAPPAGRPGGSRSRATRATTTSPGWSGPPARTRCCSSGSTGCRTRTT